MYVKSEVTLIPGGLSGDAGIVDAARVSFSKKAEDYTPEENEKLIKYLFKHGHWSPFGHPRIMFSFSFPPEYAPSIIAAIAVAGNLAGFTFLYGEGFQCINGSLWAWYENLHLFHYATAQEIRRRIRELFPIAGRVLFREPDLRHGGSPFISSTVERDDIPDGGNGAVLIYESFRIKAPIFVARQAVKHQIGLCWNEVSRRYVSDTPEIYEMSEWRAKPNASIKQGSGGLLLGGIALDAADIYMKSIEESTSAYEDMLRLGTAPEQARAVLPLSTMTEWVWTGSLAAWHRICRLRLDSHAQKEIRDIAEPIETALKAKWPNAWQALTDRKPDELG